MIKYVLCHHAERADRSAGKESERFPGITQKGEKETREKTKVLAKMICNLPDGYIVILGGCSKAIRTKSTLMVFTDELRRTFQDEKDIIFSKSFNPVSPVALKGAIYNGNNGVKIIIDYPMSMEEFTALHGQKELVVAKRVISGLSGQISFFRKFFPERSIVLINITHAAEIDALINFLQKRSSETLASIVYFM